MGDLDQLLGSKGMISPEESGAAPQDETWTNQKAQQKKPKPSWVTQREQATGITAQWSDDERRWVFPGLSTNMGGPKKGANDNSNQDTSYKDVTPSESNTEKTDQGGYTEEEIQEMKNAPATYLNAYKDYVRGGYQDAYDKLMKMKEQNPEVAKEKDFKKLWMQVQQQLT